MTLVPSLARGRGVREDDPRGRVARGARLGGMDTLAAGRGPHRFASSAPPPRHRAPPPRARRGRRDAGASMMAPPTSVSLPARSPRARDGERGVEHRGGGGRIRVAFPPPREPPPVRSLAMQPVCPATRGPHGAVRPPRPSSDEARTRPVWVVRRTLPTPLRSGASPTAAEPQQRSEASPREACCPAIARRRGAGAQRRPAATRTRRDGR